MDFNVFRETMDTNAYGPLQLTQRFIPLMRRHGYGRIVNVTSGMGELAELSPSYPAYRLSKLLLNLQTQVFAQELRGSDILINAVCPGWVRTEMGGPGAPRSIEQGAETIVWLATLPKGGPQGGYFRDRQPLEW
jgi:NAD(P)-dependent dehydrogenase (short-subunit alcohol dehydrogenase family)